MSLERTAHSERTNGSQFSGEIGRNSEEERKDGRWMKGDGLRQRRAYNWKNNMKELVFRERESDRKRILVY